MKKFGIIILATALFAGGLYFALSSQESDSSNLDSSQQALSSGLSQQQRELVNDHIKSAVKRQTLDATDKSQVEVDIEEFYFNPTVLKVSKGTSVIWTNKGHIQHDVKISSNSPNNGPDSDLLETGQSYIYKFDKTGLYLYFCSPHPSQMRAVIEVVE